MTDIALSARFQPVLVLVGCCPVSLKKKESYLLRRSFAFRKS